VEVRAKAKALYMPICAEKSPLEVMNSIDQLSSLWQAHQEAIQDAGVAQAMVIILLS